MPARFEGKVVLLTGTGTGTGTDVVVDGGLLAH